MNKWIAEFAENGKEYTGTLSFEAEKAWIDSNNKYLHMDNKLLEIDEYWICVEITE